MFCFFVVFFFIKNITRRLYNIPADSLFTESPPFLRDIIFISWKHSLLFSMKCMINKDDEIL